MLYDVYCSVRVLRKKQNINWKKESASMYWLIYYIFLLIQIYLKLPVYSVKFNSYAVCGATWSER